MFSQNAIHDKVKPKEATIFFLLLPQSSVRARVEWLHRAPDGFSSSGEALHASI
jgi:hypothetical protein